MAIRRFTVQYNTLVDPGSVCTNPDIYYTLPQNITIPCSDTNSVDIEINTDVAGPYCLSFVIDCTDSCSTCGQIVVKKCFCVDPDDCGDCENCDGNVCVSTCADGKVCEDDHCVGCTGDGQCLCNQECTQGECQCPTGLKKRADGCCVECFDGEDLGNCLVCEGGVIVAKDCPNGHCNPTTGDCSECLNNEHCTGPNECCGANGKCECCPGYILDPVTNQCVEAPPCTSSQQCEDIYGPCSYCTATGCQPKVCPNGQVCDPNTGECVPGCTDGNCPEGYGCLNGRCVPCSELSCSGSGELCQYASGCQCVGQNCEYIDCDPQNVDLVWTTTPDVPGVETSPGLPALQGTTSITPDGIIYIQPPSGAGYMNHIFNLAVSNGTSGQWTLLHNPNSSIPLGTGTSISFDLAGTAPSNGPNLVGFLVKFVETNTGRTATWAFYRTPTAPITAPNVWNSEFQSTGTSPSYSGGIPGSVKLCATNGNFKPTGVTNVQTTGSIVISFVPDGANCLIAHISGCGTWTGDVILSCGGNTITVPAPSFTKDPANCCEPTDPNCGGWGTGDPCTGITIQPITLVALPTYGLSGSGDGEFLVIADWTTAGLSFFDMFYLDPADGCWSTNNAGGGDTALVTNNSQSPFGPSVSNLSVVATMGDGGCVRLGHTCELRIAGCKKIQGEVCLTECQSFTVDIVDLGNYTYMAAPSLTDEPVSYEWSYPGLVNNTGQTITIVPQGGLTTLRVTAYYGSPVKCTATDTLTLNVNMPGCRNRSACNYDPTATQDDGTCVIIGNPSYNCALGGFQPGTIDATSINTPVISWLINGSAVNTNSPLNPGNYTVDVAFNGVVKCSKTLTVPQCYNCVSAVCTPAPLGNNIGLYQGDAGCGAGCDKNIQINVIERCVNNGTVLTITATGSTGSYTLTVDEVGGAQVVPPTALTSSGSVSTIVLSNGLYRVVVVDPESSNSKDYYANCHDCADDLTALTNYSINCAGNYALTYTITPDPFATHYTVQLLNNLGTLVPGGQATWTGGGTYGQPLGVYPGDGLYTLRITNDLGCSKDYDFELNCNGTLLDCPITSAGLTAVEGPVAGYTSLVATFVLDASGGTYTGQVYATTGGSVTSCAAASIAAPVGAPVSVIGVIGTNTLNFANIIPTPGVPTCYAVQISRGGTGYESCVETVFVLVEPSGAAVCSGSVTGASYNTATGATLVSWDFENTSDSLTVLIQAYASGVCGTGAATTVTSTGNGENGLNIPFAGISQLPGVDQCVKVTVFDEADAGCTATTTFILPGCTCNINFSDTDVVVDPDAQTATIDFTTSCTSTNINVDISGDATGSGSISDGSADGTTDSHQIVLALTAYNSIGGTIAVEITDDANGSCTKTVSVALPSNCTNCGQAATFSYPDSVVTSIVDIDSNTIVSGTYDMAVPADITSLENDIEAELIGLGANICEGGGADVGRTGGYSGVKVLQDSTDYKDLNYAITTNAAWTGTRKTYFGDCGCNIGRLCTYTTVIDLSSILLLDTFIDIAVSYGQGTGTTYSNSVTLDLGDTTDGISPSELSALALQLKTAIENASGCNYTVGSVTITYDATPGSEALTIVVANTNAGLGIVEASFEDGASSTEYFEFTQSACA